MRLIIPFLSSLLLLTIPVHSNCIIIWNIEGTIYAVADTRQLPGAVNQEKVDIGQPVKRIHQRGTLYYAFAGLDDSAIIYYADSCLLPQRRLIESANIFADKMIAYYEKRVAIGRDGDSSRFLQFKNGNLSEMVFFAYRNGKPEVILIEFRMNQKSHKIIIEKRIDTDPGEIILGDAQKIDGLSTEQLKQRMASVKNDPLLFIEGLVQLEVSFHPRESGCPLDILTLSSMKTFENRIDCNGSGQPVSQIYSGSMSSAGRSFLLPGILAGIPIAAALLMFLMRNELFPQEKRSKAGKIGKKGRGLSKILSS
ncbi:MAG TPA: hypothetical protein VK666_29925 [Chryseolinea sp.]|nr:hypothetical protein [Chryseolinea sp.]